VVSDAGSGVGAVALPLTAVLALGASAMEMGVLSAAGNLPVLLLGLHVGVWVDRLPRRPILVVTNVGRGLLLALVPLAAGAGWLRMEVLWGIAFVMGVLAVTFDIAVTSYVPALVERERLVEANGTLQASSAAARVVGPGAGGWLVQAIGAPAALLIDAASFIASGLLLARVRAPADTGRTDRRGVWAEIVEGIDAVWRDPILGAMVLATAVGALAGSVQQAVYVLYVVREVGLSAPELGTVVAAGSMAARVLTTGGAMIAAQVTVTASTFVLLAAPSGMGRTLGGLALAALAQVLFSAGLQTWSVTQISLRQAITPRHLLGRVNATRRVAVFGIQPVGALLGGALGTAVGLPASLALAAAIHLVALAVMVASPLRRVREVSP
jgi:MFS family permease